MCYHKRESNNLQHSILEWVQLTTSAADASLFIVPTWNSFSNSRHTVKSITDCYMPVTNINWLELELDPGLVPNKSMISHAFNTKCLEIRKSAITLHCLEYKSHDDHIASTVLCIWRQYIIIHNTVLTLSIHLMINCNLFSKWTTVYFTHFHVVPPPSEWHRSCRAVQLGLRTVLHDFGPVFAANGVQISGVWLKSPPTPPTVMIGP